MCYVQNQHLPSLSWFRLTIRHVSNESLSLTSMEWKAIDSITGTSYCLKNVFLLSNTLQQKLFYFYESSTLLHCACNTVQLLQQKLDFVVPKLRPPTIQCWTPLITQDFEIYAAAWAQVVSQQDWKTSSYWQKSWKAVILHLSKNTLLLCFCVLPGSAETLFM